MVFRVGHIGAITRQDNARLLTALKRVEEGLSLIHIYGMTTSGAIPTKCWI